MRKKKGITKGCQRGFTLIEALLATIVMMVGLVAVAQLVPVSLSINSVNRASSTALVVEQRILEQMLDQPLTAATCIAPACPDAVAGSWSLGSPAAPGNVVGSPVTIDTSNSAAINFSAGQVAGYSFNYIDPNDPYGATYDVRWAVVTYVQGSRVTGKRFLLGARQTGGNGFVLPITLDTTVEK